MKYLEGLNPSQKEAALWDGGPLLVLAGPGSGKTKTLISRVARIIDENPDESFRILCLTFTRKAAAEMRERLFGLVPAAQKRVHLTTFHSFATDVLRQHGSYFQLNPDFEIIDRAEQISIVKKIITENPQGFSNFISAEKALDAIEYLFKELVKDEDVAGLVKNAETGLQLTALFKKYKEILCKQNALDYGAIIYLCEQILRERPRLARQLRSVYKYVSVDEFQDTNKSQYSLLRSLASERNSNLFIVGDDDQIIYQWNGASPKRIEALKEQYDLKVIQLPENYRCPAEVVDLANTLIGHNDSRLEGKKPLQAMKEQSDSSPVSLQVFADEDAEAEWVAEQIGSLLEGKVKPADIVILARNTKLLERVGASLEQKNIQAHVQIRKTQFESAPLRFILSALKLSLVRSDEDIVGVLTKSLSDCTGVTITPGEAVVLSAQTSGDYLQALSLLLNDKTDASIELKDAISSLVKGGNWSFINNAFSYFDERSACELNADGSEAFADYEAERSVWNSIINDIGGAEEAADLSLGQLLQEIALANKSPEAPSTAVRCLTVHASKGMEFSHVFLIGMAEDQLPSFQAKKKGSNSHEMQEERRNCFVAITRTKQTLTMTYAKKYNGWDKEPSRFLSEMGLLPS